MLSAQRAPSVAAGFGVLPGLLLLAWALCLATSLHSAAPVPEGDLKPLLDKLDVKLKITQRPEWPPVPGSSVEVTLVPLAEGPSAQVVSFGLPLGPGWLEDDGLLRVLRPDGSEIPAFTKPLVQWWIDGKRGSLRSVLIQFEVTFPDRSPQEVTITWDRPPARRRSDMVPITETRLERVEQPPDGYERAQTYSYLCPRVLALLPPEWLCASLLAWQQVPVSANQAAPWFDQHLNQYFPASLRNISATAYAPHLFDRPAAYVKMYLRSGEMDHLLAALKAADFYLQHLGPDGFFDLKPMKDVKYVFTEGFALMYMLTGDERYTEAIGRALQAWEGHTRIEYRGEGFWTERHHGFGMMAYLHAYEVTGDPKFLDKATRFFEAAYAMQLQPGDGREPDGAWLHSTRSHSERDPLEWITSPWMSAFLTDAIWKYWMLSGDPRCPVSLAMYAKFTLDNSITPDGGTLLYIAASPGRGTSRLGDGLAHNMEGVYLLSLGYYLSGGSDRRFLDKIAGLWPPIMQDDANVPPRKFTWRFRETSMLVWFLTQAQAGAGGTASGEP